MAAEFQGERASRYGHFGSFGECLWYGSDKADARCVVLDLIVDDGVPSRGVGGNPRNGELGGCNWISKVIELVYNIYTSTIYIYVLYMLYNVYVSISSIRHFFRIIYMDISSAVSFAGWNGLHRRSAEQVSATFLFPVLISWSSPRATSCIYDVFMMCMCVYGYVYVHVHVYV